MLSHPIRLVVIDLDGTSVGHSNQMTDAVKTAIQAARSQGVEVAIATGRMYQSALRFHRDLQLSTPLMTYQGAYIRDPRTEEVHRHWTLPQKLAIELVDYLEQPDLYPHLSIHCYINDQLYVREITADTERYAERSKIQPIAIGDLRPALEQEPTKILALTETPEIVDFLLMNLRQRYKPEELYFTKSVDIFFEATNPQVNKGAAVRYLAEEMLGLQAASVMTIGDNFNDLEMLQYAGVGVAMADAPEAVKAIADWVAPSVAADGVAKAIAHFIL